MPVSLLASLVLATAAPLPQGQSSHDHKIARHYGPVRSVSLDLATGAVTRRPAVLRRAVSTVVDFTNIDLGGFVGVDSGAGACEWIDAAVKGFHGNASDLMNNVVFAYCSSAKDPASGGPGGEAHLGFYEGYTVGGPASTSVGLFHFTGLPANTSSSSFWGGFRCYYIDVQFANLVAFADGSIGYSWLFTDVGTTGVFAATFPFLSCVQSCTGWGPDGQGMVNLIDRYCPPGNLHDTFYFGTYDIAYHTSISMEIREVGDLEANATSWNGNGVNQDVLQGGALVVGGDWGPSVTLGDSHGSGGPLSLNVRQACASGAIASSPLGGRQVQVLTQGALALRLVGTHDGTTGTFPTFRVPPLLDLVGQPWAAQALVVGGGFADCSTARCGLVGTVDADPDP
jgi:hypothetical protein